MKLFVLDAHTIYGRGLAASLEAMADVHAAVAHAETVRDAWEHPALFEADVVILDPALPGGTDFIGAASEATGARVIVCTTGCDEASVRTMLHAGAAGVLSKDALTRDALAAAVQAARNGVCVVAPGLLESAATAAEAAGEPAPSRLTDREQAVLSLIADGHRTRDVAELLSYSERTVKNILHHVAAKLGSRSRSQAVAFAVREGLI